MRAPSYRTCLLVFSLGLMTPLLGRAETPSQVHQRLEQYRQLDAEAARKKTAQKAEAERRREQTREWQEKRRREEYARRWRCYGDVEIDVLLWRQQKDETWVTASKPASGFIDCPGSDKYPAVVLFGDSLVKIAQRYNLTISELLRLNPGLEAARLVVGTQIRLAQSSPERSRVILRLSPTASVEPRRFKDSVGRLVQDGVLSLDEAGKMLGRRLSSDSLIGVNCTSLMINRKPAYESWGSWIRPEQGSADEHLVIDRCAAETRMTQP